MQPKQYPILQLEEPKHLLERLLSWGDKRPNFIKRGVANALGYNAIAVKYEWQRDKEQWWKKHIFGGEKMHVNPKYEEIIELEYLNKNRPAWDSDLFKKFKWLSTKYILGHNEVTNDGEIGYANQAAEEAPAANEDFFVTALSNTQLANPVSQNAIVATDTWMQFDNPGGAAIAGSNKNFDATFPKRNDGDTDNTGAGVDVVSFLTSYTTTDFNDGGTTIKNFSINDQNTPVAATKLLTHGQIAAFNKTATDTLKFFINHEMRRI